jgi:deoxycytidylate deaminase
VGIPQGTKTEISSTLVGLEFPEAEVVFALVYPVGTDYSGVLLTLGNYIKRFNYRPQEIRISDHIATIAKRVELPGVELAHEPEAKRINSYMDGGNKIRELTQCPDFVTAAAVAEIARRRPNKQGLGEPLPKTIHIFNSLKRPEEVGMLRKIYGLGFYLIGIFASEGERLEYLTGDKNISKPDAFKLMKRDEDEEDEAIPFGQRTRDTFQLADVFVKLSEDAYKKQLERFLDLIFGFPYHTPGPDEYSMFLAYSASLRSGSLSRQVGASIRSKTGDVVAVGCNDVPSPRGGLYWPGPEDQRDHIKKYDSNDLQLRRIVEDLLSRLGGETSKPKRAVLDLLRGSLLDDVSEFGRAVHAEMDSLFTCARNGVSPLGAELFTTTFPCHNCTRHIITAGVQRVVYIEPYPKSMAAKLHKDAIILGQKKSKNDPRIPFEAFVGIGPRRFFDLFSMKLSRGSTVRRKKNGRVTKFERGKATPRIQMLPSSYLQREQLAAENVRVRIDVLLKQESLL